ncbi:hypothetical protein FOZ60_012227 [Perkinsus olseni]|uniref:aspartyl aminopeptidase n=1 Tax=Perkinsus olseni TaxID=32597 RepID=A0A7J6ND32_PEROL|nr:hypothetical protein FOZ60_012227 [Perkinsus olseni]
MMRSERCKVEDILDFDICMMDATKASFVGLYEEFLASARLDNLVSTFSAFSAITTEADELAKGSQLSVAVAFNHEEVGSRSATGANSKSVQTWIERVLAGFSAEQDYSELVARSILVSADGEHAVHPNYPDRHQAEHKTALGKGVAIKINPNQLYATNAATTAITRVVAEKSNVPLQEFTVKNGTSSGSTIGPMLSANLGIRTVDLGITQWAMHSIRETCSVEDIDSMLRLCQGFYRHFTESTALAGITMPLPFRRIECVDAHCGGEPARIVLSGVRDPLEPGKSVYEKMEYFRSTRGDLRQLLLREPRGYPCQNADLIVSPQDPKKASFGCDLDRGEYPPMSGHNTICTATVLLETGLVPMEVPTTKFTLEAPAGLIDIEARCSERKAESITFTNVPAFVVYDNEEVEVPSIGPVLVSAVYSGMWYAVVDDVDTKHGIPIEPENGKSSAPSENASSKPLLPVVHPENPEINSVSIIVLRSSTRDKATVVMPNGGFSWDDPDTWTGMLDRSPCGTGTSAVMALEQARGRLQIGEKFVHSGILGTTFEGLILGSTTVGPFPAIITTITGQAWITGYNTLVVDPSDPHPAGFTVADIWSP